MKKILKVSDPLNINERSICNASQNSTYANYIKSIDVLICDGISMTNKFMKRKFYSNNNNNEFLCSI